MNNLPEEQTHHVELLIDVSGNEYNLLEDYMLILTNRFNIHRFKDKG